MFGVEKSKQNKVRPPFTFHPLSLSSCRCFIGGKTELVALQTPAQSAAARFRVAEQLASVRPRPGAFSVVAE